jgi:hypothetical protein
MAKTKHLIGEERRARMPPTVSSNKDPCSGRELRDDGRNIKAERAIFGSSQ